MRDCLFDAYRTFLQPDDVVEREMEVAMMPALGADYRTYALEARAGA
jgi:hypothetical protein